MHNLAYDLHLHSCLSPCASDEMTPINIVAMAKLIGLDIIALTDHNSCKNCASFLDAAKSEHILAICGMELTTSEEIHVLCYFEHLKDALLFDAYVEHHQIGLYNRPKYFGNQLVYNTKDRIHSSYLPLLIAATSISFSQVYTLTKHFHGFMVPAHLDRTSNSLLSNLGTIPPDSSFTTVELRDMMKANQMVHTHPYLQQCTILNGSDAHQLDQMGLKKHYIQCGQRSINSFIHQINYNKEKR